MLSYKGVSELLVWLLPLHKGVDISATESGKTVTNAAGKIPLRPLHSPLKKKKGYNKLIFYADYILCTFYEEKLNVLRTIQNIF